MTVEETAELVKQAFGLKTVSVYGLEKGFVSCAAVCPGSGGSEIEEALKKGADVLITGDISHHQGIDAAARNMAVIDGGHYGLEHIFIDFMCRYLEEKLGGKVKTAAVPVKFPVSFI